ncbi:uncharacterized protein [Dysidea avara]|uniref:uncharacterized protein n=1 Tax=Dysidea avara TaxID=196820 RepID=UPI003318D92A
MSIERSRCSAYSDDLRWRIVWHKLALGMDDKSTASNLCVDPSTVFRIMKRFNASGGSVSKKEYPKDCRVLKLTKPVEAVILNMLMHKPGAYLREVQEELSRVYGVNVHQSTLCQFLKKSGFTRQKMKIVSARQDKHLRETFAVDVSLYDSSMLVFVDETGTDMRDSLRKYGYSVRGKPITSHKLTCRGQRVSAIVAMTTTGILDYKLTKDTVDSDEFKDFIEGLLPMLMNFNGTNPNSIVIMDNCAIHHCSDVTGLLREVGVMVHFLPPYSPDYNPIEEAFSKVKTVLKCMESTLHSGVVDLETCIAAAIASVTPDDCQQYVHHCQIYG